MMTTVAAARNHFSRKDFGQTVPPLFRYQQAEIVHYTTIGM